MVEDHNEEKPPRRNPTSRCGTNCHYYLSRGALRQGHISPWRLAPRLTEAPRTAIAIT
jgi:hypothetical protein